MIYIFIIWVSSLSETLRLDGSKSDSGQNILMYFITKNIRYKVEEYILGEEIDEGINPKEWNLREFL